MNSVKTTEIGIAEFSAEFVHLICNIVIKQTVGFLCRQSLQTLALYGLKTRQELFDTFQGINVNIFLLEQPYKFKEKGSKRLIKYKYG